MNNRHLPHIDATATAAEDTPTMAFLPVKPHNFFLGALFVFAVLTTCYVAAAIILPVILAIVLKLVLHPAMRFMLRMHIPTHLAAFIIMAMLLTGIFGLGTALSAPAAEWAQQMPAGFAKIQRQIHTFMVPIKATQTAMQNAEGLTNSSNTKPLPVTIQGSSFSDRLLTNTQSLVRGVGETFLLLYFLLASGDTFLRRFIEMLPRFSDKRQAVLISQRVESDLSAYLATITLMNGLVGIATSLGFAALGLHDAILWGVIAFVLNYIPMLGPLIGIGLFVIVGVITQDGLYASCVPAVTYLLIHMLESSFITPLLLARRFTLNPVLIVLSVFFWYWMWGVPGAILATPILAVTKIICDKFEKLAPFGHFMAG